MQKNISLLLIILSACSIFWCIYRDIQIEKQYTGDLRNRIVGARLQKDGHAPYFYKWKNNDGIRYYDPQNFDTLKVSNITATPFFHEMLYPVADFPQRTISKLWLAIEYFLLFITVAIAISFAKNKYQQYAVLITGLLFLYSNAWTSHVSSGQTYLFIPFFAMLFCYLINKNNKTGFGFIAGICAAILLLIRPNTFFFLLPFLFLLKRYPVKYKSFLFASFFLVFIYAFGKNENRIFWTDYKAALTEQVLSHQQLSPALSINEPDPVFKNWEGWDMNEVNTAALRFPFFYSKEHGNAFVIINHSLNTKIPVWSLAVLSITLMLSLLFFIYKKYKLADSFNIIHISILSYSLYMTSDFFSPIHRFQYNGVQWIFPLLILASLYNKICNWIYAGIIIGLLLNSINYSFIPMQQTLGEYIIFLFLIIFIFNQKPKTLL